MTRTLKTVCKANLLFAILVVGAYIVYGLWSGLPIDQHFLGSGPAHTGRGGGAHISPWALFAVVESILLLTFFIGRYAEWDMRGHRVYCGLVGALGLFLLLMSSLVANANPNDEFVHLGISRLDSILALYVWGSHIFYALIGSADD